MWILPSSPCVGVRLFATAVLLTVGCDKSGEPTQTPEPADAPQEDPAKAGIELRYALQPGTLQTHSEFTMTQRGGGQFAEANLGVDATLALQPTKDERLEVGWTVSAVPKLELQGALQPPEGSESPVGFLAEHGEGAYIVDRLGQRDDEASRALPVNEKRREVLEGMQSTGDPSVRVGQQLLTFMPLILALPGLPEPRLPVGEPVTFTEQEETELGGMGVVLPTESEYEYELVKLDDSSGRRIAEVTYTVETTGAAELQGGNTLTIDSVTEGTMLFDVDGGRPVSMEMNRTEAFAFGEFTGESTTMVQATWEPGGPSVAQPAS